MQVDAFVANAIFQLPQKSVYRFPSGYPRQGEVFAPVWQGSGRTIPCVVISPPDKATGPVIATRRVLLFHGNSETLDGARPLAARLAAECEANVYIVEYPGYWKPDSPDGEPSPRTAAGTYANAAFASRVLAMQKDVGPLHIVGYSLGTALAVRVAKELGPQSVQSLSLIAPICSVIGVAATSPDDTIPMGFRPLLSLIKPLLSSMDVFCADRDAPFVRVRSAVVYGDSDEVVNNSQGERMAALLRTRPLVVEGETHATVVGSHQTIKFIQENIVQGSEEEAPFQRVDLHRL